jgi:CHASE3 domain sensor protein
VDSRAALNEFSKWLAPRFNRKASAAQEAAQKAIESGDESAMREACRKALRYLEDSNQRPAALLQWLREGSGDPALFK